MLHLYIYGYIYNLLCSCLSLYHPHTSGINYYYGKIVHSIVHVILHSMIGNNMYKCTIWDKEHHEKNQKSKVSKDSFKKLNHGKTSKLFCMDPCGFTFDSHMDP